MKGILSQSGLFHGLPSEVVDPVVSRLETMTYSAGQDVFREGELGDALYIIICGNVRLSRSTADGNEKVLTVLGPSDHFGELAVFDPIPRTETASAVTDVRLARMPHTVLRPWIEAHPEMGERLLRVLARRLWPTQPSLPDQFFTDVPGRVARVLLRMADRFGSRTREGVQIKRDLKLEEIARLAGASRESVQEAVGHFVERGWIRMDGTSLWILDEDHLRRRER